MNIHKRLQLSYIFYYPAQAAQLPMFSKPEKLKSKKFHNNSQSGKLTIWKQVALLRAGSCGEPVPLSVIHWIHWSYNFLQLCVT